MFKKTNIVTALISTNFLLLAFILLLDFGPWIEIDNSTDAIITMLIGFAFILIHGYLIMDELLTL